MIAPAHRAYTATVFPPFRQHRLLRGGHVQTIAGVYLPGRLPPYRATRHTIDLPDADRVVLHDDAPPTWRDGDRVALLIHGLSGDHGSPYMQRIAHKLNHRGVRTFRLDLRGCGAGAGLARMPYHSGRSEDAAAALEAIARLCPNSPATLVGFSLGGNITLKLLGELGTGQLGNLDGAVAVSPPVDLQACVEQLQRRSNWIYDRRFAWALRRQLLRQRIRSPESPGASFRRQPLGVWQFDDQFTAPVCGFGTAREYYRRCSSGQVIGNIRKPTLIIAASDDPLVPIAPLEKLALPASVRVLTTRRGGHLGFIARSGLDADRRWMDWRVVDWVAG